ncbi:2OG-Fe(II) oxygenase [Gilvimarinus sp. F26214L]|uniref:2OG-Fe(II) oxygenase n=1 Tax=Gilvimarinus sp. DZF01 TaxID=3461371 RepID=UPI004045AD13
MPLTRSPARRTASTQGPFDGGSDVFDRIVAQLQAQGYAVLDRALPESLMNRLFVDFTERDRGAFRQAGVGRRKEYQLNDFLRRDHIYWLGCEDGPVGEYLDWIEHLRMCVNRRLFLGLFDYECHYAYYPEGAFYKKHFDAFKGRSNRRLSTILYLNPQWQPGDGGELALYPGGGDLSSATEALLTLEPLFGRMVIFLSEVFPHEVLRANRGRFSLTGWYRINGTTAAYPDPPLIR